MNYILNISKFRNDGVLYIGSKRDCLAYLMLHTQMKPVGITTELRDGMIYRATIQMPDGSEYYLYDPRARLVTSVQIRQQFDYSDYTMSSRPVTVNVEDAGFSITFWNERLYNPSRLVHHRLASAFRANGIHAPEFQVKTLASMLIDYANGLDELEADTVKSAAKALLWGMYDEAMTFVKRPCVIRSYDPIWEVGNFFGWFVR